MTARALGHGSAESTTLVWRQGDMAVLRYVRLHPEAPRHEQDGAHVLHIPEDMGHLLASRTRESESVGVLQACHDLQHACSVAAP